MRYADSRPFRELLGRLGDAQVLFVTLAAIESEMPAYIATAHDNEREVSRYWHAGSPAATVQRHLDSGILDALQCLATFSPPPRALRDLAHESIDLFADLVGSIMLGLPYAAVGIGSMGAALCRLFGLFDWWLSDRALTPGEFIEELELDYDSSDFYYDGEHQPDVEQRQRAEYRGYSVAEAAEMAIHSAFYSGEMLRRHARGLELYMSREHEPHVPPARIRRWWARCRCRLAFQDAPGAVLV